MSMGTFLLDLECESSDEEEEESEELSEDEGEDFDLEGEETLSARALMRLVRMAVHLRRLFPILGCERGKERGFIFSLDLLSDLFWLFARLIMFEGGGPTPL